MNKARSNSVRLFGSKAVARAAVAAACAATMLVSAGAIRAQFSNAPGNGVALKSTQPAKRDSMTITLPPLRRTEVKLVMKKGGKAEYSWRADSADVTFNLHGEGPDAPGGKAHTYVRGSSRAEKGEIVAVFDGVHGWSFRNTTERPVRVTVTAWGQFSQLKKM